MELVNGGTPRDQRFLRTGDGSRRDVAWHYRREAT